MRAEGGHAAAVRGDRAVRVQRAEVREQAAGGGEGARRRGIGKRQVGRGGAERVGPHGAGEAEGQLGLQDFRPVEGGEAPVLGRGPEADRDARRLAARAAGTLLGAGAGDAGGDQPGETGAGVEPGRSAEAAVDDDAHPGNGQGGLGDCGREHHPPRPARRRAQRRVLCGLRQVAVQGEDVGGQAGESGFGAADLGHAGKEGEDIAGVGGECGADGGGHRVRQVAQVGEIAGGVDDRDGVGAAGTFDHARVEQGGEPGGFQRGGHRDQAEVGAQVALQIAQQGQRQVGFDAALVDFVEDDGGSGVEQRVGEEAVQQEALGEDLDAGGGGDGGIEPGAVADQAAGRFFPRSTAMRVAAARAARRRGSRTRMRASPRQEASSRAGGMRVVLPEPGGARRTALRPSARAARRSGRTAATGRSWGAGDMGGGG